VPLLVLRVVAADRTVGHVANSTVCHALQMLLTVMLGHSIVLQHQQHLVPSTSRNRHLTVYNSLHYAPLLGIGSGTASSLPSLVLRSMLKQRRILMRMH